MKKTTWIKIIISIGALLILLVHLLCPKIKLDAISLGLIIVVILPWLSSLIESAEFPGGWKIKFRDVQQAGEKITKAEALPQTTTTATSTTSTTTTTLPPSKAELSFFEVKDHDPNLALVAIRIEIEKRIRELAEIEGLNINRPLSRLLRELNQQGVLSHNVFSGLQEIVLAGNQAAHGASVEPSVADWAFTMGPDILTAIDKKIEEYSSTQ